MNPIVIRAAVRGLLVAVVALLALFTQGCVPSAAPPKALPEAAVTRAVDVLEGVQTLAGSRELVANAARWMRVPDAWLRTPAACAVAELLSQGAAAAIPSLEASTSAPVIVEGTLSLDACDLASATVDPGALLVLSGTLDQVQGTLLVARVPDHDPAGYAVACAVLELLRETGPQALAQAIQGGPRSVTWSTQPIAVGACRDAVVARAFAAAGSTP